MSTSPPNDGFSVLVTVTVKDGTADEYLAHMTEVVRHLSLEPEFLHIEVMRVKGEPNKIKYLEHWARSSQWFIENIAPKAYVAEYEKATAGLLVGRREFDVLERCGGVLARTREGNFVLM